MLSSTHPGQNPVRVLCLVGWSVFQRGKGPNLEAPKLHDFVQRVNQDPRFEMQVQLHVETIRPIVSAYGLHISKLAMRFLHLTQSLFVETVKARKTNNQFKVLHQNLRALWSDARQRFWVRELERLKIDLIVGSNLTKEEVGAANNLGIPSIEIQHGLMESKYIDVLWPILKPNYFFVWDFLRHDFLLESEITPIPTPFQTFSDASLRENHSASLLVLLSWGLEESTDPWGAIPVQLQRALLQLSHGNQQLTFRPHPVFPRQKYRHLQKFLLQVFPGCSVQSPREYSLEEALSASSGVVLDETTSWIEAVLLGLPVMTSSLQTYVNASALAKLTNACEVSFLPTAKEQSLHEVVLDPADYLVSDWQHVLDHTLKIALEGREKRFCLEA